MALDIFSKLGNCMSVNIPFLPIPKDIINNIDYIQADGQELEQIIKIFTYRSFKGISNDYSNCLAIPIPNNQRVVIWYGDLAKTIVANL